jgi:hypothetical protein
MTVSGLSSLEGMVDVYGAAPGPSIEVVVTKRREAPTMIVPCESPDGSTTLVYSGAPAEIKDVMVVKSVRCAEAMVVAVSDILLESVSVGSGEGTVLESCSLVKLEGVVVLVESVEVKVLASCSLVKLVEVVVLVGSVEETMLVESCSLVKLKDMAVLVESREETVLVESCSLVKLEDVVVVVESADDTVLVESCSLAELEDVEMLEIVLVEPCSLVELVDVVVPIGPAEEKVLVESCSLIKLEETVLVGFCPLVKLESIVLLVESAEEYALVESSPLVEVELLVTEPEDEIEEEEEELVSTGLDEEVVPVLVSRLDVCVLVRELEDVPVVTEGREEKEKVNGIPTTTYSESVPEEGTVDVNPVAPAGICVVLVANACA